MEPKVDPELRQAMNRIVGPSEAESALTKAELLAYHLGELSEEEAEAVRERLLWDESAQQHLLSLTRTESDLEITNRPSKHEEDDWETLRRLLTEDTSDDVAIEVAALESGPLDLPNSIPSGEWTGRLGAPPPPVRWFHSPWPFQALAACLLLVVLLQTWRMGELSEELDLAYRPGSNSVMTAVSPLGTSATRNGIQPSTIELPETARRLFIHLNYSDFESYERFSVQLTLRPIGAAGSSWQAVVDPVTRSAIGTLEVDLAGPWLTAGELQIELSGVLAETTTHLASYQLRIVDG